MTKVSNGDDAKKKIIAKATESVLRLIQPDLSKLEHIPNQLDALQRTLQMQKENQKKLETLHVNLTNQFKEHQYDLTEKLITVEGRLDKTTEKIITQIRLHSQSLDLQIKALSQTSFQNCDAVLTLTNLLNYISKNMEDILNGLNVKVDTISNNESTHYDYLSKQYESLSSGISALKQLYDNTSVTLNEINDKLDHI